MDSLVFPVGTIFFSQPCKYLLENSNHKSCQKFSCNVLSFFYPKQYRKNHFKHTSHKTIVRRNGSISGTILRKPFSCTKCKAPAPNNKIEYSARKNIFICLPPS